MYVIISPIRVDKLQKYHYCNDGTMDFETYTQTSNGIEFSNIAPLIIEPINNKKDLVRQISMDIAWISLCYNIPLYIYIMTDNWYYKNLHLNLLRSRRNFGKCTEMSNLHHIQRYTLDSTEVQSLRVPLEKSYYKGDMEIIEREVKDKFQNINLRKEPIYAYKLSISEGLVLM